MSISGVSTFINSLCSAATPKYTYIFGSEEPGAADYPCVRLRKGIEGYTEGTNNHIRRRYDCELEFLISEEDEVQAESDFETMSGYFVQSIYNDPSCGGAVINTEIGENQSFDDDEGSPNKGRVLDLTFLSNI